MFRSGQTVYTLVLVVLGVYASLVGVMFAFQGKLLDTDTGGVVADGNYSIVFSLYTTDTGGTAAWQETQTVAVKDGKYSVLLGSVTVLDGVSFDQALYLGVKVDADDEMSPRYELAASPFTLNADKLDGEDGSYYLDWNNIQNMPADFGSE